jgi:hypothetical protein
MLCFFPPDDPRFQTPTPGQGPPSEEEQARRTAFLAALEAMILIAASGCLRTADCLRRFLLGELSCEELGEALGVSKATAWRTARKCARAVRILWAADLALTSFRKGEGFTVDVVRGLHVPPAGYAVALRAKGRVFPRLPTEGQVRAYLLASARALDSSGPPRTYLGGWVNDGFHLDHTVVVRDGFMAMRLAQAEGQSAVYDLAHARYLPVRDEGREAA